MKSLVHSTFDLVSLLACLTLLMTSGVSAVAQHEQVIYTFGATPGDGRWPNDGLIQDTAGNFYGTTVEGGVSDFGTVFELNPPTPRSHWTETILYSFSGNEDGGTPYGGLALDNQGNLYGATSIGGNSTCEGGCGTIFELSPPAIPGGQWTMATIYSFSGSDGANPYSSLVLDRSENLYGTTVYGGGIGPCRGPAGSGCGTVFELSPPAIAGGAWTEKVLHSFSLDGHGAGPVAPVVFDGAEDLFGTTEGGGAVGECPGYGGCGTVFELSPQGGGAWTITTLHTFRVDNGDGEGPVGGLSLISTGALVGTTQSGGSTGYGIAYGLRPPLHPGGGWSYGVLHTFGVGEDGALPQGEPTFVGDMLYGTTLDGGSSSAGTLFQLARSTSGAWEETDVYNFAGGSGGASPRGGLLLSNGAFYGTTVSGGGTANGGTAFKIGP